MQATDPRAVENPITAIFDLAEEVEARAPKVRRLMTYTRVFVLVWLLVDAIVIVAVPIPRASALLLLLLLVGLLLVRSAVEGATVRALALAASVFVAVLLVLTFGTALLLGVALVGLFSMGFVILDLVRDARSFFDYYALRYRVVRAVREADPVVQVPAGDTPVHRLLTMLARRSPAIAETIQRGRSQVPATVLGRSGVAYRFDALLTWPSGQLGPIGIGPAGGAVFVKAFDRAPTPQDLDAVRRAVEDVALAMRLPPSRVINLWRHEGANLPDATYEFLTTQVVRARLRGREHACSMELVTEMPDGTYDFIPFMVDPGLSGIGSAPPVPSPRGGPA